MDPRVALTVAPAIRNHRPMPTGMMRTGLRIRTLVAALPLLIAGAVAVSQSAPATHPAPTSAPADDPPPSQAQRQLLRGTDLLAEGRFIEARNILTAALFSGQLENDQARHALEAVAALAEKTLLSPTILPDDPYACEYALKPGDVLARVVKNEKLYVSPEFILKVNGLADARGLRAGQKIKLVRGPVHAIISKSAFTMDLCLQRDDQPGAFLKRLPVGLGKANGTPEGAWRVSSKVAGASWTAPADHPLRGKTLRPGEQGYPLGKDGIWIGLEGTDRNTQARTGYGIHGTNEPDSIGKAASSGCVRLGDEDVRLVFSLLAEKLSTVRIVP